MTKERFKTVLGKFSGNYIYCDDETIIAITYGIVKEKIEDSFGFFLMKWCNSRECWIIINWVAI